MFHEGSEMGSEKTKDKYERFGEICGEMVQTYIAKNADYGDSFGESFAEFGPSAGIIRIGDKYKRAKTLLTGEQKAQVPEAVADTLKDLACYAIMLAIAIERSGDV